MDGEIGAAEAPAWLADHPRPVVCGNGFAERLHPQPRRRHQARVAATAKLAILAEQVEQLPVLRPQIRLAGGALAQHGGKAIVKEQRILLAGQAASESVLLMPATG